MNCCWRSCVTLSLRRPNSGKVMKKFQFSRSCARNGAWGRMLMALSLASVLLRAGQTSTHSAQPVQSSAAICSVKLIPLNSGTRAAVLLKAAGAPLSAAAAVHAVGHRHFVQMLQRVVHRLEVHGHDFLAFFAVGFLDGILDGLDGLVAGEHPGQREETNLH